MKRFIAGEDRQRITLLPDCLDDYITADNPVRLVEGFVDELDPDALGFGARCRRLRVVRPTTRQVERRVHEGVRHAMLERLDRMPSARAGAGCGTRRCCPEPGQPPDTGGIHGVGTRRSCLGRYG